MQLFSYLTPISIHKELTQDNSLIEVRELFGKRKLDIGGYPQSGSNYRRCWRKILSKAKISSLNSQGSGLILGLGGGDLVKILEKLKPEWRLTAVEIESAVVDIAHKYFGITKSNRLQIVTADAKKYVHLNKNKYDLIVVDLYDGDNVPEFVKSEKFLKDLLKILRADGIAIFNYASYKFKEPDFKSFEKILVKIFGNAVLLRDWGHTFYLVRNNEI